MASPYDGKPGFEEALAGVPDGRLDRRISNIHLHTFAQSMKSWREVAPYLGLTEAEEEEIVNDHRRHQEQKCVDMLPAATTDGQSCDRWSCGLANAHAG